MPKTNIPNYRLHKATGQAFVELTGRRFYLGKHGSKASKEEYEKRIAEYLANGRKLPPTLVKKGISCQELAIHFLEWAEGYYVKNGVQTATFGLCRRAVSLLVKHYGNESTNNFSPLSLDFLQKLWVENGLPRLTVNRFVCIIKRMFKHGVIYGWVDAHTSYALQAVDNLKKGRTKAPEYRDIHPVDDAAVDRTLPFLPPIVADMVRVQRLCGMRPQDVRNMRFIDIDRSRKVWCYRPFTHKMEHTEKTRFIPVGPKAQAILTSYLVEKEDAPESFLFSPQDSVRLQRIEKRQKRKTFNKQGRVQPSQRNRAKPNPKRAPREQYTKDSYAEAISRACKKAGVPLWTPNQLRHAAGTNATANYSLEAAKELLGHASVKTTEKYYVAPLPELAERVAWETG